MKGITKLKITIKFRTKKPFAIGYYILICLGALLTIGRWFSIVNNDFVLLNAEFHSHISNFSLSLLFYLGVGYYWLLSGVKFRFVTVLGAVAVIANFACETVMGFMNTADIIDALYGTVGVALAFLLLLLTNKYGLIQRNSEIDTIHSR